MPNITVDLLIDSRMVLALLFREENNVYASDNTSVFVSGKNPLFFSKTKSIQSIIQRRYGDKVLREVRKFEKLEKSSGKCT